MKRDDDLKIRLKIAKKKITPEKDPPPDHEKFKNGQNKFEKYFKENI